MRPSQSLTISFIGVVRIKVVHRSRICRLSLYHSLRAFVPGSSEKEVFLSFGSDESNGAERRVLIFYLAV